MLTKLKKLLITVLVLPFGLSIASCDGSGGGINWEQVIGGLFWWNNTQNDAGKNSLQFQCKFGDVQKKNINVYTYDSAPTGSPETTLYPTGIWIGICGPKFIAPELLHASGGKDGGGRTAPIWIQVVHLKSDGTYLIATRRYDFPSDKAEKLMATFDPTLFALY